MKTEAEFDQHAEDYHDNLDRYLRFAGGSSGLYAAQIKVKQLTRFVEERGGKDQPLRCLDIACGTGLIANLFQDHGPQVFGVDLSHDMIHQSPQRKNQLLVSTSEFLPFADESFDLTYAVCLFHHLDESARSKTIREIKRVTKKNGYILIFEHNPFHPAVQVIVRCCPLDKNANLLTPSQVRRLYEASDLKIVE